MIAVAGMMLFVAMSCALIVAQDQAAKRVRGAVRS
jgi:hypothetical protein